jgi:hypothetical protein
VRVRVRVHEEAGCHAHADEYQPTTVTFSAISKSHPSSMLGWL